MYLPSKYITSHLTIRFKRKSKNINYKVVVNLPFELQFLQSDKILEISMYSRIISLSVIFGDDYL